MDTISGASVGLTDATNNPYIRPLGIKHNNASKVLAWKIGFDSENHFDRQVCVCVLDHAQHPRIVSSVYNTAKDQKKTAAKCVALIMQGVTSSIVIHLLMLPLLCSTNVPKDNLRSI